MGCARGRGSEGERGSGGGSWGRDTCGGERGKGEGEGDSRTVIFGKLSVSELDTKEDWSVWIHDNVMPPVLSTKGSTFCFFTLGFLATGTHSH